MRLLVQYSRKPICLADCVERDAQRPCNHFNTQHSPPPGTRQTDKKKGGRRKKRELEGRKNTITIAIRIRKPVETAKQSTAVKQFCSPSGGKRQAAVTPHPPTPLTRYGTGLCYILQVCQVSGSSFNRGGSLRSGTPRPTLPSPRFDATDSGCIYHVRDNTLKKKKQQKERAKEKSNYTAVTATRHKTPSRFPYRHSSCVKSSLCRGSATVQLLPPALRSPCLPPPSQALPHPLQSSPCGRSSSSSSSATVTSSSSSSSSYRSSSSWQETRNARMVVQSGCVPRETRTLCRCSTVFTYQLIRPQGVFSSSFFLASPSHHL